MTSPINSDKPIRILLWAPCGAGTHYNGAATTFVRLFSRAAKNRMQLSLAHGYKQQEACPPFQEQYLISEIDGKISQFTFIRRAKQWIRRNSHRFDVLHATDGYERSVSPAVAAETCGLPAVLTVAMHRADLGDKTRNWRSALGFTQRRRQRLRQLSAVVATSNSIFEELVEYGVPESNIARIPYGVDIDLFRPASRDEQKHAREQLGIPDRFTILFVGSIVKRKRPHLIIDAVARLKRRRVEAQAVFVGPENEADYADFLKSRAQEQGVDSQLNWFGFSRDVAPFYSAADVFVLASESEGLPNAMLEAMASGIAPIGTAISGITDLIDDGATGRIVTPDAETLAEVINDYASNDDLRTRHGEASRQRIVKRYSHNAVLDAYDDLFRRVIAGTPIHS